MFGDQLIGKDLSNQNGWIDINIDSDAVTIGSELVLYLNHPNHFQENMKYYLKVILVQLLKSIRTRCRQSLFLITFIIYL